MPPIVNRPSVSPPVRQQGGAVTTTPLPGGQAEPTIDVSAPTPITETVSNAAAEAAAKKLIDVVTQHKDRDGKMALEGWGKGDAKLTERRSALSTLLSAKTGGIVDEAKLKGISTEIAKDIEFLRA